MTSTLCFKHLTGNSILFNTTKLFSMGNVFVIIKFKSSHNYCKWGNPKFKTHVSYMSLQFKFSFLIEVAHYLDKIFVRKSYKAKRKVKWEWWTLWSLLSATFRLHRVRSNSCWFWWYMAILALLAIVKYSFFMFLSSKMIQDLTDPRWFLVSTQLRWVLFPC